MNNELYIIGGHNGAGKTTFLKQFVKQRGLKYIDADEIAKSIPEDKFSLLTLKAGRRAFKKLKRLKEEKDNFAVETTLSGKIWKKLIGSFKRNNYKITIFFIYLDSIEGAFKRISVRKNKEGHYVTNDVVRRRYGRSIRNFWFIYKDMVDEWYLVNNSLQRPILIAYKGKEKYQVIDRESYKRFMSITKKKGVK